LDSDAARVRTVTDRRGPRRCFRTDSDQPRATNAPTSFPTWKASSSKPRFERLAQFGRERVVHVVPGERVRDECVGIGDRQSGVVAANLHLVEVAFEEVEQVEPPVAEVGVARLRGA
jgi:hypothetical protein